MGAWAVITTSSGCTVLDHTPRPAAPAPAPRPHVDRAKPANLKSMDIVDLLRLWDRAAFGITMRTIEILILRGDHTRAVDALRTHIRRQSPLAPTMQSPLADVLPIRIANLLEAAGFKTLIACQRASDAELLTVNGLGDGALELIRETVRCVESGRTPPQADDLSDLAPDWPAPTLETGFYYQTEGERIVSRIEEALQVLLESGDTAVAEIDTKINRLTGEIENLKRMRKLLAPNAPSKTRTGTGKADWSAMSQAIADVVREQGPLKAKAIAEIIGADYAHVGRIAKQFPNLLSKNADGLITLADAA